MLELLVCCLVLCIQVWFSTDHAIFIQSAKP